MPARNIYHNGVRNALLKDGWTITHDPLRLRWGGKDLYHMEPLDAYQQIIERALTEYASIP